jgi:hypothetical protein
LSSIKLQMQLSKKNSSIVLSVLLATVLINYGCKVGYGFKDISIPPDVTTVKVNLIENNASYVNVQLSPQLTDRLRRKIVTQTRLKQTNGDNADWEITGKITEYSFSTSGISNGQTSSNRINVAVHITVTDQKKGENQEYNISRSFDFPSTQTLQQAEANRLPDIIKGLSDDIFNQIFSSW